MSSAFSQPISLADEGIRKSYESSPGKLLLDKFILIELGEPIADDMLVATKSKFFCYSTIVGQSLTNYILALVGSKLTTSKTWIPSSWLHTLGEIMQWIWLTPSLSCILALIFAARSPSSTSNVTT